MSIEKPISTIRKAVKGTAEVSSEKESLMQPEQKHYDEAMRFYRFIKVFEPDKYENVIKMGAEGYDLKQEMSPELYKVFTQVWGEANEKFDSNLGTNQNFVDKSQTTLDEIGNCVKDDPRIQDSFLGKEELFNKGMEYVKKSIQELQKEFGNRPATRVLNNTEFKTLINKAIEYLRKID